MQKTDILKRLRATILALSVAEQRVANFCLSDPSSFSKLSVGEIADMSNVSKPTVVRFCRSAGYEGLVDFRRKLLHSIEDGAPFVHQSIGKNERPINIKNKLIDNVISTLLSFRESVRPDLFEVVVQRLMETHTSGGRVLLVGIGASALAAQDAQTKLFRMGVNAFFFAECHDQILAASLATERDTFILFSNSGRTRELIEICELANKRGAMTVVVTATNTPLSYIGKYRLASDNEEIYENYSPMLSRVLQLVLVDILITCFSLNKGTADIEEGLQEFSRSIEAHRLGRAVYV